MAIPTPALRRRAATLRALGALALFVVGAGVAGAAPMYADRYGHSATLLNNGDVLAVGGFGAFTTSSAEIFDVRAGAWRRVPGTHEQRAAHSAVLLPDGKVLVTGGATTGSEYHATTELFDPATATWRPGPPLAGVRAHHTATPLLGGGVLIAGGRRTDIIPTADCEIHEFGADRFVPAAPMSVARTGHVATRLADGRVLVAGGVRIDYLAPSQYLATAELYNPASNTWTPLPSMASPRTAHTASVLRDGRVLVVGGHAGGAPLATAEIYDPAANRWSSAGTLAVPRETHTATVLPDGRVLVAGGGYNTPRVSAIEIYDPDTGLWTSGGSLAVARAAHTATLLPDARVLIAGGLSNSYPARSETLAALAADWAATTLPGPDLNEHQLTLLPSGKLLLTGGINKQAEVTQAAQLFDPASGTWAQAAPMPYPRYGHTASLLPDGRVLVVGGDGPSVHAYDPVTDTWSQAASLTHNRIRHMAVVLGTGKVLVAGGDDQYYRPSELYDPATDRWDVVPNSPVLYVYATATLLRDGRVLVVGGRGPDQPVGNAFLFDPRAYSWRPAASLAFPRYAHRATLLADGKVLVVGGAGGYATTEVYDPEADTWTRVGDAGYPVFFPELVTMASGELLRVGGYTPVIERYDPDGKGWHGVGALAAPLRSTPKVALLNDGTMLAVGGGVFEPGPGATSERLRRPALDNLRRPVLDTTPSLLALPGALALEGDGFTGAPDVAGGTATASSTNIPVVRLQRIDNGAITKVDSGSAPWTRQRFQSRALAELPQGWYRASVVVDGVESLAKMITVANEPPAPPSTVAFAAASYRVNEVDTSVMVGVMRTGDCTRPAGVNLVAVDVTARQNFDYFFVPPSIPVTWGAGDCFTKFVPIAIFDNTVADGPRRFDLQFVNPSNVTAGTRATAAVEILDDETAAVAMPTHGVVVANPFGPLKVDGATLAGNALSGLTKRVVLELGPREGFYDDVLHIDFATLSVGAGNVLVIRSGAANQHVVLNNTGSARTFVDGLIVAEGGNGAPPPRLHLSNPQGISVLGPGRVMGSGGLLLDALGASWTIGQPVYNDGAVDGGSELSITAASINGSGLFKGDTILLSTFGHANNPANGSRYLHNGLNLAPATGRRVALALNGYGTQPQVFNVLVHGDAQVQMPPYFVEYIGLPNNNFATNLAAGEPSFGGGQLIAQATGTLTLGGFQNDFVFPGGMVLKAGLTLDIADVRIHNAWTLAGRPLQGLFLEAPAIVSSYYSGGSGRIQITTNNLNWVNFSTPPRVPLIVFQVRGGSGGYAFPEHADDVAPHINPYASMIETAAAGGCWTCNVDPVPVRLP